MTETRLAQEDLLSRTVEHFLQLAEPSEGVPEGHLDYCTVGHAQLRIRELVVAGLAPFDDLAVIFGRLAEYRDSQFVKRLDIANALIAKADDLGLTLRYASLSADDLAALADGS